MREPVPHSHCHACGTGYDTEDWPRRCPGCGDRIWRPFGTVPTLLQEVLTHAGPGLLIMERTTFPFGWALPSGYVEFTDPTLEYGASRETWEETRLVERSNPTRLMHSARATNGNMIVFARSTIPIDVEALSRFEPTEEAGAVRVAFGGEPLVFPTHMEAMRQWFERFAPRNAR